MYSLYISVDMQFFRPQSAVLNTFTKFGRASTSQKNEILHKYSPIKNYFAASAGKISREDQMRYDAT